MGKGFQIGFSLAAWKCTDFTGKLLLPSWTGHRFTGVKRIYWSGTTVFDSTPVMKFILQEFN